jgi:hypothetical protein
VRRDDVYLDPWAYATAIEGALANSDADEATRWLMACIAEARGDAFALASTLRQLTQVWQLEAHTPPGDQLIPPLQVAVLRAEGGTVEVAARELQAGVDDRGCEVLFGEERYQDVVWFQRGLKQCRSVGLTTDRATRWAPASWPTRASSATGSRSGCSSTTPT